jgi:hypothetical protein
VSPDELDKYFNLTVTKLSPRRREQQQMPWWRIHHDTWLNSRTFLIHTQLSQSSTKMQLDTVASCVAPPEEVILSVLKHRDVTQECMQSSVWQCSLLAGSEEISALHIDNHDMINTVVMIVDQEWLLILWQCDCTVLIQLWSTERPEVYSKVYWMHERRWMSCKAFGRNWRGQNQSLQQPPAKDRPKNS